MSLTKKISSIPMFNSEIFQDNSAKQKILYLSPINLSPTNIVVVLQMMIQS